MRGAGEFVMIYPSIPFSFMRYIHLGTIILLAFLLVVFSVQNFREVTVGLFGMSATVPLSLLVLLVFILGMYMGGAIRSFIRTLVRGAKKKE